MRALHQHHAHQRCWMCFQTNELQMEFLNPIKSPKSPLKNGETHISAVCITMYSMPPQNVGHSADQCTTESEKEPLSYPNQRCKETHSLIIKGRGQRQLSFAQTQERKKRKGRLYLPQPLLPYRKAPSSRTCLTNWSSQQTNEGWPQRLW